MSAQNRQSVPCVPLTGGRVRPTNDGSGVRLGPASEVEAKPGLAETNRANGGRSREAASREPRIATMSDSGRQACDSDGGEVGGEACVCTDR